MPQHRYKARVTNTETSKTNIEWTHAWSFRQAIRYFCERFHYPPYVIEEVTDTITEITLTKDDWSPNTYGG